MNPNFQKKKKETKPLVPLISSSLGLIFQGVYQEWWVLSDNLSDMCHVGSLLI